MPLWALPGRRRRRLQNAYKTCVKPMIFCMFPGSLGASLGGMEAVSRRCPDVIRAAFGQRPSSVRTTPHPAPTDPSDIQKSLVLYRFYKHFQAGLDGVQTASREAIRRGQGGVWAASEWRPGGVLVASRRLPGATRTPLARAPGCRLDAVGVGCKMVIIHL